MFQDGGNVVVVKLEIVTMGEVVYSKDAEVVYG